MIIAKDQSGMRQPCSSTFPAASASTANIISIALNASSVYECDLALPV
jgi:hypothetical protein